MAFPDIWTTERLRAERLRPDHLAEIHRMHRDEVVMTYIGGLRDEAQSAAYLARNLDHWARYGFGVWIMYEREGADPIGRGVLRHLDIDGTDEIEVGYAFYRAWWGRGLATEIALACVERGRRDLAADTLVGITHPENRESQHVLRKAGMAFDREAVLDGEPKSVYRIRWPGGGS